MEPTVPDPGLPSEIGRYRILGQIGAGGMGTVYRAHDPQLDRIVALKLPHFAGLPEQRAKQIARFQREARAAAAVWHPHVCPIFDVGEHDGQPFVVMALIQGESLAQRLVSQGRFEDVAQAVALALQLLDALAAVHALGIIHRDVKPGNILLDGAGRAVLTDFGLARPGDEGDRLTSEGIIVGTPSYMAPEQAAGLTAQLGPRTDLYSLGVVLYEMLTGRLPFDGPPLTVLHRIVHEAPPPPSRFRPDLAPALEAAVLRALQKDPNDRFGDARAFAASLTPTSPSAPTSATQPTLLPADFPVSPPPPTRRGRQWTLGRVAGWLAGAVFVGIGAFFVSGRTPEIVRDVFIRASTPNMAEELGMATCGLTVTGLMIGFIGVMLWASVEMFFREEGLFYWARQGSPWSIAQVIRHGVVVDARDPLGETALMLATARGHTEVVKRLLVEGASPNLRSSFGQTALDVARAKGQGEIVALLQPFADRPDPPAVRPTLRLWRPQPAVVLIVCSLIPATLNGWMWMRTFAQPVTTQQLVQMAEAGQIKGLEVHSKDVFGDLKDPWSIAALPQGLRGPRFWVQPPHESDRLLEQVRQIQPTLIPALHNQAVNISEKVWRSDFLLLPIMTYPVVVMSLVFLPLLWLFGPFGKRSHPRGLSRSSSR